MRNIGSIMNSYDKKNINNNILEPSAPSCNCRVKDSCPLYNQAQLTSVKLKHQKL